MRNCIGLLPRIEPKMVKIKISYSLFSEAVKILKALSPLIRGDAIKHVPGDPYGRIYIQIDKSLDQ